MQAVWLIQQTSRRELVPMRAYHCDLCGRWHLTKSERRTEQYEREQERSGASVIL